MSRIKLHTAVYLILACSFVLSIAQPNCKPGEPRDDKSVECETSPESSTSEITPLAAQITAPCTWPADHFDYGIAADTTLARGDDNTGPPVTLPSPLQFYGRPATQFYPNNNGIITFDQALINWTPIPFPLSSNLRMIAPYWADVDTRPANGGHVYYRVSTPSNRPGDLTKAKNVVNSQVPGASQSAPADYAIVMTWDSVGYYNQHTNLKDSFQVMVAKFGPRSFTCFFYNSCMQWTTGDASGGVGGFAVGNGIAAQVGYDAGNGVDFYSAPGSRTNAILDYVKAHNEQCYEITNPVVTSKCPVTASCSGLSGNAADRCPRCQSDACRGCMKAMNDLRTLDVNAYNNGPDRCLQSGTNNNALNCLCDIALARKPAGGVRQYTTNFFDRCTRCGSAGCEKCLFCEFCTANAGNQWNQNFLENCVTSSNPTSICGTDFTPATCT